MCLKLSKDNIISFNYQNNTFSLIETISLKKLNTTLNDGTWHSILLLDKFNHLEFLLDNILISSSLAIPFSLKRFALDSKSQITFGKDPEISSFKV